MEFLYAFAFFVLAFLGLGVGTFLAGRRLKATCGTSGDACGCSSDCDDRREGAERMMPVIPGDH